MDAIRNEAAPECCRLKSIQDLYDRISERLTYIKWTGDIATGLAGTSLFMARYASRYNDATAGHLAIELSSLAIERGLDLPLYSLFNGLLGSVLASRYVHAELGFPPTQERLEAELIALALEEIRDGAAFGRHCDLLDGCIGAGLFGLEVGTEAGRALATKAVSAIAHGAQQTDNGCTWPTSAEFMLPQATAEFGDSCLNLGLAHGIPGALAYLSICGMSGVEPALCSELTRKASNDLRSRATIGGLSIYPHTVSLDGTKHGPSRVSWCYGDLSVAVGYTWVARFLGDSTFRQLALQAAIAAAKRQDESAAIVDNSICHGAAGAAYLFRWLDAYLEADVLREASTHWFNVSAELLRIARSDDTSPGFLQGHAGTGLALLDLHRPGTGRWPRLLML